MVVRLFLVGFGHVGQGFARLLLSQQELLQKKYGLNVKVVGIATRRQGIAFDPSGLDLQKALRAAEQKIEFASAGLAAHSGPLKELLSQNIYEILAELSITNLTDGEPATGFIRTALKNQKHVITTNKGPVALHFKELTQLARRNNCLFKYEGTVMAGTPLINFIQHNLAGLKVVRIQGIVNGSCNFILTRMEEGLSYQEAVAEARERGYLEADPTADVEGWDAVAKAMILARTVFDRYPEKEEIERQGITHFTRQMILDAQRQKKVWRLIATLEETSSGFSASVRPVLLNDSHPLATVRGVTNAVTISTDRFPDVTVIGPGAGDEETGFAVLNDLIQICQNMK